MVRTFTGKNTYLLQDKLRGLISTYHNEVGEFSVEQFDASEVTYDALLQVVQTLPFLVDKKLVVINGMAANNELLEKIEGFVNRVSDGVEVILVDQNLDKRKSYYKMLLKHTELTDFSELKESGLATWLVEYAATNQAQLSQSDALFLVQRVGSHQLMLAREIEKLALYNPQITRDTIELLTDQSLQANIFALLDSVFAHDADRVIALYREQRRVRVEPQYILSMLTWQLYLIAQAVFAEPQTESTLTAAGVSPFSASKALQLARKTTRSKIKHIIKELASLDAQTKTSVDSDAGLELFLIQLTTSW